MKVLFVKKVKKVVCLMMTAMLIITMASIEVKAATFEGPTENEVEVLRMIPEETFITSNGINNNIRTMLYNCIMSVKCSSSGMEIAFSTDSVQDATIIGVKDIVIKQRVWYGWKTVATSSGGYFTNTSAYLGTILYTNAIRGEEYRITCTHYADADEYTEVHGELDIVFTY